MSDAVTKDDETFTRCGQPVDTDNDVFPCQRPAGHPLWTQDGVGCSIEPEQAIDRVWLIGLLTEVSAACDGRPSIRALRSIMQAGPEFLLTEAGIHWAASPFDDSAPTDGQIAQWTERGIW